MRLYFKDQAFSFELLRAASYAPYGGAEIGECLAVAARIREGDFESWHVLWHRTAESVHALASHGTARPNAYMRWPRKRWERDITAVRAKHFCGPAITTGWPSFSWHRKTRDAWSLTAAVETPFENPRN